MNCQGQTTVLIPGGGFGGGFSSVKALFLAPDVKAVS